MGKRRLLLLILALGLYAIKGRSQNVGINEDGSAPNANAILDIKSTTKGVLIPRVSTAGRLAIPNTKGLLVYDTTAKSFWYNDGTTWQNMSVSATGWSVNGNKGTNVNNFVGTTDSQAIRFRVGNLPAGAIDLNNVALGSLAALSPKGNGRVAIGAFALQNDTSNGSNVAVGQFALSDNGIGFGNTGVGFAALERNISGSQNTGIGSGALHENTTGVNNTGVGTVALKDNMTGNENTALGDFSLLSSTGSDNTAIGSGSMQSGIGSNNTTLGAHADLTDNFTNATAIGFGAMVNASNKVRIGNTAVTVIEGQVPFTTPSDGRFKFQVQEDVKGLEFIMHLRPITYQFDVKKFDDQLHSNDKPADLSKLPKGVKMPAQQRATLSPEAYVEATAIRRSGFIAQEVEKAADSSGYNFSGIIKPKTDQDHYSLSYESFVVPLVKAIQDQQKIILDQQKKLTDLQQQLDELKQLVQQRLK